MVGLAGGLLLPAGVLEKPVSFSSSAASLIVDLLDGKGLSLARLMISDRVVPVPPTKLSLIGDLVLVLHGV